MKLSGRRLETLKSAVDKELNGYLPSAGTRPSIMHQAMRYAVFSGGKRLRPILVIESCLACGGNIAKAMPAACALELVHTYSLAHDDLPAMDDDDTRRGKPALHKKYNEAVAILAGDALLTLAFGILADSRAAAELAGAAGTFGMVGGQTVDLEYKGRKKTKDTLRYINLHKTARLFEASCRIGGLVSGARVADKIEALGRFGRALGLSFQIVDDILDHGDYVKGFGASRARMDAKDMADRAKAALSPLGNKAGALKELADYILSRTN